ncbi:hypothetical protein ACFL03_11695 [Thermodesulfobacteriota bacterium]
MELHVERSGAIACLLLVVLMVGCATTRTPFTLHDGAFATFVNWQTREGVVRTSYFMNHIDGKYVNNDLLRASVNLRFRVPPGRRSVVLRIIHAPKGFTALGGGLNVYRALIPFEIKVAAGKYYRPNAVVKDGIATAWVEEVNGERVSELRSGELIEPLTGRSLRLVGKAGRP